MLIARAGRTRWRIASPSPVYTCARDRQDGLCAVSRQLPARETHACLLPHGAGRRIPQLERTLYAAGAQYDRAPTKHRLYLLRRTSRRRLLRCHGTSARDDCTSPHAHHARSMRADTCPRRSLRYYYRRPTRARQDIRPTTGVRGRKTCDINYVDLLRSGLVPTCTERQTSRGVCVIRYSCTDDESVCSD